MGYKREWILPHNSKKKVDKAGENLASEKPSVDQKEIVDNWRLSHVYPMYQAQLKINQLLSDVNCIIVSRLKRLDAIENKIRRSPKTKLSRMQDLGGCRVIVEDIATVYRVKNLLLENSHFKMKKDYIEQANIKTGYRGIHLIYTYQTTNDKYKSLNGQLIEIQIRTKLQHNWATSLETIGSFTNNGIKFGQGDKRYISMFCLLSQLNAIEEGTNLIPEIENDESELKSLIQKHMFDLNIIETIGSIKKFDPYSYSVFSFIKKGKEQCLQEINSYKEKAYFVLSLNKITRMINVIVFEKVIVEAKEACYQYLDIEKKGPDFDSVLVYCHGNQVKEAYPNYLNYIDSFIGMLDYYGLLDR